MAAGGVMEAFCASDRKHQSDCEYHVKMADGGEVPGYQHGAELANLHRDNQLQHQEFMKNHEKMMSLGKKPEETSPSVHYSAAHKGLLGLMKDTGRSNLQDPDQHIKMIESAKQHHDARIQDPNLPKPRSSAGKLGHHIASGDHEGAAEELAGHPLAGLVGKQNMTQIMSKVGGPMMANPANPKALRGSVDFLHSAIKGEQSLDKNVKDLVMDKNFKIQPDKRVDDLKAHIDDLAANPSKMLDSGDLGHYLPGMDASLAATTATAVQYLNSLKPLNSQSSPLDEPLKPSKSQVATYDRQVNIAQNPMLVLQHAKQGTLLPQDLATLQTIYPSLHKNMVSKINEQLLEAKAKGKNIPYNMRSSMSLILGEALDSTQTSKAMQAILNSSLPKSTQPTQMGNKPGTMTSVAYQADKAVEQQTLTPLQARQINRNKS